MISVTNMSNTSTCNTHCHYCSTTNNVGFYLSHLRKWACAGCYTTHIIIPRTSKLCKELALVG